METYRFAAQAVVWAEPENAFHLAGFADHTLSPRIWLVLQRAFEHDQQDIDQGMATYHVEWCSQDNSGYGGIDSFELGRDQATLRFSAEVTQALDGLKQVEISFSLTEAQWLALANTLRSIFADSDCQLSISS